MQEYLRVAGEVIGWAAEIVGLIVIAIAILRGTAEYIIHSPYAEPARRIYSPGGLADAASVYGELFS